MVTRTRKLLGATLVLLVGIGLAWPFHRSGDEPPEVTRPAVELSPVEPQRLAGPIELTEPLLGVDRPVVAAPIANKTPAANAYEPLAKVPPTQVPSPTQIEMPMPRPALPPSPPPLPAEYPTDVAAASPGGTPVYTPLRPVTPESPPTPAQRIHVVHNGDTLGRLAHRYLGSEDRALEIFDVNREVLDNPHLLPIGAELNIPPR